MHILYIHNTYLLHISCISYIHLVMHITSDTDLMHILYMFTIAWTHRHTHIYIYMYLCIIIWYYVIYAVFPHNRILESCSVPSFSGDSGGKGRAKGRAEGRAEWICQAEASGDLLSFPTELNVSWVSKDALLIMLFWAAWFTKHFVEDYHNP